MSETSLITDAIVRKAWRVGERHRPAADTLAAMRAALQAVEGDIFGASGGPIRVGRSQASLDERLRREARDLADAFRAALEAGDRAHLLTIGSPARGLALRVTLGNLSRRGRWHGWLPDVFLIWRGKRV